MIAVLALVGTFLLGLLAGCEFTVRYAVRAPLAALDDRAHILLRQGLIRTLRVLVPAVYLPGFLIAIAVAIIDGGAMRWTGVAALVVWTVTTFFGTVPINEAALDWPAEAPPSTWKTQVERWERLNTVRTWAAVLAFAVSVTALRG
jgi:uncharacterized membrane protein